MLSSKWWNNKSSDIKLVYLYSITFTVYKLVLFMARRNQIRVCNLAVLRFEVLTLSNTKNEYFGDCVYMNSICYIMMYDLREIFYDWISTILFENLLLIDFLQSDNCDFFDYSNRIFSHYFTVRYESKVIDQRIINVNYICKVSYKFEWKVVERGATFC